MQCTRDYRLRESVADRIARTLGSVYRKHAPPKPGQKQGEPIGPYWISYKSGGKWHTESTRIKGKPGSGYNLNEAKRILSLREGDIAKGSGITPQHGRQLFTDALRDVELDQIANERRALDATQRRIKKHIAPYFVGRQIGSISTGQIRAYTAARKKAGAENATINRELAIIRRAFRLAVRAGTLIAAPHVEMLTENNTRKGFVSPEQFAQIRSSLAPESYADAAEWAFVTGWRLRSEILTLDWNQVDAAAGIVRIDPGVTKGREGRTFPLTTTLRAILRRRARSLSWADSEKQPRRSLAESSSEYPSTGLIFTDEGGSAIHPKRFYRAWDTACTAAKVPEIIPHDLRRSAILQMERRMIPRQVSMKLVGHKTESVFRRYAIVTEADILDAGASLDQPAPDRRTSVVLRSKRPAAGRKRTNQKKR